MSSETKKKPEPTKLQQHPLAPLSSFLEAKRGQLEAMLPKSTALRPEKLIKLAMMAATSNPDLGKCDMGTVYLALAKCAELGLEPSGTLGHAYLVPFGGKCQLIIGYRGLIDLAHRSGVLKQIRAAAVYQRDVFEYEDGLDVVLRHVPHRSADRGELIGAWVVIRLESGAVHHDVMWRHEIDAVRARSRASGSGPWVTDYAAMALKTVARRALKWVPMTGELVQAFEAEAGEEVVDHAGLLERVVAPPPAPAALPADTVLEGLPEMPAQREKEDTPVGPDLHMWTDEQMKAAGFVKTGPGEAKRALTPWEAAFQAIRTAKTALAAEAAAEKAKALIDGEGDEEGLKMIAHALAARLKEVGA